MKLIIAAHGQLAQEVVNSANMVFGGIENAEAVTFVPGENAEDLKQKYQEHMTEGEDVLFLVDLFGGSPYNAAFQIAAQAENTDVISGLSLPMLLDVVGIRETCKEIRPWEVYDKLGKDTYIKSCRSLLKQQKEEEEEDEL